MADLDKAQNPSEGKPMSLSQAALLYSAAPDLYEALEEALAYANENDWPESLREKARKALRLARGESGGVSV